MEAQPLTATMDVVQPTTTTDGDIDLTVSGGTAPYSYTGILETLLRTFTEYLQGFIR